MADVIEIPPPAVDQSGNLTIWCVPTIADLTKPKMTEVPSEKDKRITYSFTPNGWGPTSDQEISKDARLTLPQDLEALGKITAALAIAYVDSIEPKSAAQTLKKGLTVCFIERRGVPTQQPLAAGDLVRIYQVELGVQSPGTPDGTGKFTISQKTALRNVVGDPVAMVA